MRDKTVILLLVFIGLLVYFNSLLNGFVKDDFIQIINNTNTHSISNIPQIFSGSTNAAGGADKIAGIFYRPLMLSSYALLYSLFGPAPFFFHLFQVILHVANAILIYTFLKRFFRHVPAFFIALIFLIHPINNEAVVYIANLQEIIFFFFGMLALLLIQNLSFRATNGSRGIPYQNIAIPIVLFLSMLSKESGILFLAITIIYSFLYSKRNFKFILISNFIIFWLYLFLRFSIAKMFQAQESVAPISQASLIERLYHIPAILTYYLKTFIYPAQLSADQFWYIRDLNWGTFYLPLLVSVLLLCSIAAGGYFLYKQHKAKFTPYLFFSIWLLIGLALHLQILPLDATVADRWFYFPIVGLLGIIALLAQLIKIRSEIIKKLLVTCCLLLVLLLSFRTYQRNFDWKDEITLFSHDIKFTPKNFVLDNLYATALINNDDLKKAKPYVESSIKEHPFYANLNNMAIIYASEKNYKEAKKYLYKAVQVSQYYMVYENYANFLLAYDDLKEAESFTQESLKIFPKNPKLWMILAKIQYLRGDQKSAIKSAEKSYNILPNEINKSTLSTIKSSSLKAINKFNK